MKDINTVLAQKLEELKRCRMDLFCLKRTIGLLTEPKDWAERVDDWAARAEKAVESRTAEEETIL